MTEEERAIICAALAFAAADREDDTAQAAYDRAPQPANAARLDRADQRRWDALAALLAAVARYEETRRG